jgi:hypothetical protein
MYIYILHYTHTHTDTENKSTSEIAFVVLRLHCQLKVVSKRSTLIKSGIEHFEDTFWRARVGGVFSNARKTKAK